MWVDQGCSRPFECHVGLIRLEPRAVTFPAYAILSGKFRTTNNGNHSAAIVDTTGSLGVTVRCNGTVPSAGCIEYRPDRGQILPNNVSTGYPEDQAVSPDDLEALMDVAAQRHYYSPAGEPYRRCRRALPAAQASAPTGHTAHNSLANPGVLSLASGSPVRGTTNYTARHHANLSGSRRPTSCGFTAMRSQRRVIVDAITAASRRIERQ